MRITDLLNAAQVDERLEPFQAAADVETPRGGWARAIREALGMTNVQLARRMKNKAPQSVDDLMKSEAARTIQLKSLDELAQALNCRVVYALVPDRPIKVLRRERAMAIAAEKFKSVFHTMSLEDQSVDTQKRLKLMESYADQLQHRQPRKLWD